MPFIFACLFGFVWVEDLRPSQQFFSHVGTECRLSQSSYIQVECFIGVIVYNMVVRKREL